ncbi:MAG: histone H1 [Bacteroidota bacterium]
MANKPKRPKDTNQLAKLIVDLATGAKDEEIKSSGKNVHAVELGRMGGLKGGKARAKALSAKKRKEIAKKAAKKRWGQ